MISENLQYGRGSGVDIVMQLYIDDAVPSRGHRHNLMDSRPKITGICSGTHPVYGFMTGMNYAGGYTINQEGKALI